MKPLVVTPGDPRGIGPEVAAKALRRHRGTPVRVVGDVAAFGRAADAVGLAWTPADRPRAGAVPVWDPGDDLEPVEVAAVRLGARWCLDGEAAALVTGPIHKGRLAARGFGFAGHTDFLGHLAGVERPVMAFVGGTLRVALVTTHLPLRDVPDALTTPRVHEVIAAADRALRIHLGLERPRLVACGLNPHAGDGGLLGAEDDAVVRPAVEAARAQGIDVIGPVSAEAAFRQAAAGRWDLVVAMYHDQGLVPLKLVDFGSAVNWTLGLPFVRTSVDHGTADDIAGRGEADPASFSAALLLAEQLVAPSAAGAPRNAG